MNSASTNVVRSAIADPAARALAASSWRGQGTPDRCRDQLLFETSLVRIGRFRARPDDEHFRFSGAPGEHLLVFPRTPVGIRHLDAEPFVADCTTVTFYNPQQIYFRFPISEQGDVCEWISLAPGILRGILEKLDDDLDPSGEHLFRFTHGPTDPRSYAFQRMLTSRLERDRRRDDPLLVEEAVLRLVERVLENAYRARLDTSTGTRSSTRAVHRRLAQRARELLAARYREPLTLEQIAEHVACSPFHLSRVFRAVTGRTLYQHRNQLRLSRALLEVVDGKSDLSDLAAELGFSSHSHFTANFRKAFGVPPSRLRRMSSRRISALMDLWSEEVN